MGWILLLCLSKVVPLHAGEATVSGRKLSAYSARELALVEASVPQRLEISFPFRCIEVVLMGRYPHQREFGSDSDEDLTRAMEAMRLTDTLDLAQRRITEISGGEAQRVLIARTLAQETELLLLDEATANLDVAHKMQMFDLFSEKNNQGATFLCAMHDLNLAALYCQRLIFLKNGRISVDGPTKTGASALMALPWRRLLRRICQRSMRQRSESSRTPILVCLKRCLCQEGHRA
jgi:iron complex transport system ATP-binding protein